MELFSLPSTTAKCSPRLDDELDSNGSHQAAEHDNANSLNPSTTNWVLVDTWSCCQAAGDQHDTRGNKVHEGICCGCKQRQGARGDGGVHLDDEKAEVHHEGSIDGKLDLGSILDGVESSQTLFIAALEELVDQLVLSGVEFLFRSALLDLHG